MARTKKTQSSLDSILFSTPEQKVLRLLLAEPTTNFTPRVISSRLKGIRGLGGVEGIMEILHDLQGLGMVDFFNNQREVRLHEDNQSVHLLKTLNAVCDMESLRLLLEPFSTKGILFGSRATGKARSDSDYDLFVVTDSPSEVEKIASSHPLGKSLELLVWKPEEYDTIEKKDPTLFQKLQLGVVLWGSSW